MCFLIDKSIYTFYDKLQEDKIMKTSELLKILKKNGCCFIRHGKRHDIWFSPTTNKQFPVPRHKDEMKAGTAKSILDDAGIQSYASPLNRKEI